MQASESVDANLNIVLHVIFAADISNLGNGVPVARFDLLYRFFNAWVQVDADDVGTITRCQYAGCATDAAAGTRDDDVFILIII